MTLFRRGGIWWYEFQFLGQRIRESSYTKNKTLAAEVERTRRQRLVESAGRVRREKPILFTNAASAWLAGLAHISYSTREIYTLKLEHLKPVFGKMLLCDISATDIGPWFLRQRALWMIRPNIAIEANRCKALPVVPPAKAGSNTAAWPIRASAPLDVTPAGCPWTCWR